MYLHVWVQVCVCVKHVKRSEDTLSATPQVLSKLLSEMVSHWPGTSWSSRDLQAPTSPLLGDRPTPPYLTHHGF